MNDPHAGRPGRYTLIDGERVPVDPPAEPIAEDPPAPPELPADESQEIDP